MSAPRFRERVLALFRARENVSYLRSLLPGDLTLESAVEVFASTAGAGQELMRGVALPRGEALDAWAEVRRLNREFLQLRQDMASTLAPEEPFHMRAFISDSLRPPGLEHLNGTGPLYALREERPDDDVSPRRYGAYGGGVGARTFGDLPLDDDCDSVPIASRLLPMTLAAELSGAPLPTSGRFMRYEQIPFWQVLSRGNVDRDIDETLGLEEREMGGHVRGWDMSRVRRGGRYGWA